MDNVQNCDSYTRINIPSSQTYGSYFQIFFYCRPRDSTSVPFRHLRDLVGNLMMIEVPCEGTCSNWLQNYSFCPLCKQDDSLVLLISLARWMWTPF
jgi:hypothetical protein